MHSRWLLAWGSWCRIPSVLQELLGIPCVRSTSLSVFPLSLSLDSILVFVDSYTCVWSVSVYRTRWSLTLILSIIVTWVISTRKTSPDSFLFSIWSTLMNDISWSIRAAAYVTRSQRFLSLESCPPTLFIGSHFPCASHRRNLSVSSFNATMPRIVTEILHCLVYGICLSHRWVSVRCRRTHKRQRRAWRQSAEK